VKGAPPYIPFIETLEFAARVLPRDLLRHYLGESASEIARLMPELRRMYPDIPPPIELPPEQQRRYLFNAYREFVDRAAGLTPIVVVFEDLHWADEASLLLLRHLAQSVSIIPVLMIGTYRDVDLDVNRPFAGALESWVREKLATRLTLRRFGLAAVQELLTSLSGKKPPDSLVSIIHAETDGNPFFVEEVYHHLNEEGKLFDDSGRLANRIAIRRTRGPPGRAAGDWTPVAAAAGTIAPYSDHRGHSWAVFDLLAGSAGAEPSRRRASTRSKRPNARSWWSPIAAAVKSATAFVHELVRQTLVEALSLPRRQRLHERSRGLWSGSPGASDIRDCPPSVPGRRRRRPGKNHRLLHLRAPAAWPRPRGASGGSGQCRQGVVADRRGAGIRESGN
jgi:hypothetical protein